MPSAITKNRFAVIEGGGQPTSPWQEFPQTVLGRSPFNRHDVAYYRFSKSSVVKMDVAKRRQPIFDGWLNVIGKVPPINNSSSLLKQVASRQLLSISDAHACFRGVKRAVGDDKNGFDVLAFVSCPKWGVRYTPSMSCLISWFPIPDDLVFVSYVRLDHPASGRYGSEAASGIAVRGVISHWQFVEAAPDQRDLPVGYHERYRRRMW